MNPFLHQMSISFLLWKMTQCFVSMVILCNSLDLTRYLLEFQEESWSDSEDESETKKDPIRRIQALEKKLALVKQDFADYRSLISQNVTVANLLDATADSDPNHPAAAAVSARDDDTHYFQSYGENGR